MRFARKTLIMLLLIFTVTLLFPLCVSAATDSPSNDGFLPSMEQIFSNTNPSIYLNTYRPNYNLDMKDTSGFNPSQIIGSAFNSLANICFSVQTGLTYLLVCIVYFAFQFSFVDLFSGVLKTITAQLQTGLFNDLSSVAIATLGLFFCVRLIKQQKTQAYLAIVQTIIIVAMAYAFMRYPVQIVGTIDNGSNALSQEILTGTYKAANAGQTPDSAVIGVCDNLWVMLVHQPWEYFEFGNTTYGKTIVSGKTLESTILTMTPGSDERQALINDQAQDGQHFGVLSGAARIGKMVMYAIPFLLNWLIILLMCGAMLGYKLLVILLAMIGVIIFLLALIPWWGFAIIKDWASKMISYGAVKIILTLVVTILFIFNNIIFSLNDKYGILLTLILQLLCFLMVYLERERLFGMFTKFVSIARSVQYGPGAVRRHLKQDPGLEHRMGDVGSNAMGGVYDRIGTTTRKLGDKFGGSKHSETDEENGDSTNNTSGGTRSSRRSYSRNYGGGEYGDRQADERAIETSPVSRNHQENVFEHSSDLEREGSFGDRGEDLKNLKKLSEQVLEFQYEQLKKQEEERSKELGREKPEYSDYVKTVMNREARKQPKFDSRELTHMMGVAQKVTAAGGSVEDIKDYISKDKGQEPETLKRPESLVLRIENGESGSQTMEINPKVDNQIKTSVALANEFNKEFDKQYDPRFFEGLMKKYGEEQIGIMLDRMKGIKNTGEHIENPAGYLTKGLKNNSLNKEEATETELSNRILERKAQRSNGGTLKNNDAASDDLGIGTGNAEGPKGNINLGKNVLSKDMGSSEDIVEKKYEGPNESIHPATNNTSGDKEAAEPVIENKTDRSVKGSQEPGGGSVIRSNNTDSVNHNLKPKGLSRNSKINTENRTSKYVIKNQQNHPKDRQIRNIGVNQKGMRTNGGADE